jgi:hypothetical protein
MVIVENAMGSSMELRQDISARWRRAGRLAGRLAAIPLLAWSTPPARAADPPAPPVAASAQGGVDADHHIRLLRDGTELEMVGEINAESAAHISRMLQQNPRVTVLQLTSEGGTTGAGFALAKQVHDRALTTYVPSMCVSACTLVFMAGRERYMAPDARLGFHQAIYIPQSTSSPAGDATKSNEAMKAFLLSQGVAPGFVDHALSTPHESVWLPTTDELLKAHVITALTSGARFADPSFGRGSPEMVDQTLLNSPLLRAMKKADPGNYERMRNELFQTVRAGSLDAEYWALNEVHFNLAFRHAAAVAGDDAVLAVTRVNTDILEMINNADPAYCVAVVTGRPTPEGDKGPTMPRDLAERRSAAMTAVFETSMAKPQPAPSYEEAKQIMDNLVQEMYRTYGDDWQYLRHPEIDPRRSCAMHIAIRKRMASIDLPDRSVLLRALLSGKL